MVGTVMSRLSRGRERLRELTQDGSRPRLRRVCPRVLRLRPGRLNQLQLLPQRRQR